MKKLLICICSFCVLSLTAQNVSNIDFYLQDDKLIVTYDLDKEADVYLYVKFDNSKWNEFIPVSPDWRDEVPALRAPIGDVGRHVKAGSNKIIWDFTKELSGYYGKISADFEYTDFFGGTQQSRSTISSLKIKVEACPVTCEPEMVYIYFNEGWGGYWIGKYETTIAEFAAFIRATGYKTQAEKDGESWVWNVYKREYELKKGASWKCDERGVERPESEWDKYPVIFVSWEDAMAYCRWLSKRYNKTYSLPTECEWYECATELPPGFGCHPFEERSQWTNIRPKYKYAGSDDFDEIAWFSDNSGNKIHIIGQKKMSEKCVYDACGNVWEFTVDYYNPNANSHEESTSLTPFANLEPIHIILGNSFIDNEPGNLGVAVGKVYNSTNMCNLGFRVTMKTNVQKGQTWKSWTVIK